MAEGEEVAVVEADTVIVQETEAEVPDTVIVTDDDSVRLEDLSHDESVHVDVHVEAPESEEMPEWAARLEGKLDAVLALQIVDVLEEEEPEHHEELPPEEHHEEEIEVTPPVEEDVQEEEQETKKRGKRFGRG